MTDPTVTGLESIAHISEQWADLDEILRGKQCRDALAASITREQVVKAFLDPPGEGEWFYHVNYSVHRGFGWYETKVRITAESTKMATAIVTAWHRIFQPEGEAVTSVSIIPRLERK